MTCAPVLSPRGLTTSGCRILLGKKTKGGFGETPVTVSTLRECDGENPLHVVLWRGHLVDEPLPSSEQMRSGRRGAHRRQMLDFTRNRGCSETYSWASYIMKIDRLIFGVVERWPKPDRRDQRLESGLRPTCHGPPPARARASVATFLRRHAYADEPWASFRLHSFPGGDFPHVLCRRIRPGGE